MDTIQLQMSTNKTVSIDLLENEMQALEEEGYKLEIQLTSLVNHLKTIREGERSPEAN
jgi:hypothetical protein